MSATSSTMHRRPETAPRRAPPWMMALALSVLVMSSYGWLNLVRALGDGRQGGADAANGDDASRTGRLHVRDASSAAGGVASPDRLRGGDGSYRDAADGAWRMSVLVPWLRLASRVQVVVVLKNATTGEVLVDDRGGPLVIRHLGRHKVGLRTHAHTRKAHKLIVLEITRSPRLTTNAAGAANTAVAAHLHAPNRRRHRYRSSAAASAGVAQHSDGAHGVPHAPLSRRRPWRL